jgi:hypothetical protein
MRNCFTNLRSRLARLVVDPEIVGQSRVAWAGEKLIRAAVVMRAVEPVVYFLAFLFVVTLPVLAQAPSGPIFGGTDQTVGNGVREAIRWARNILFLLGVGACAWGAVNYFLEKPYAKQFIGGGMCMGFGAIASLAFSFAQGQAVDVDTDLGD